MSSSIDIKANSDLRAPIARAFGFDPFERVVEFLIAQSDKIAARDYQSDKRTSY